MHTAHGISHAVRSRAGTHVVRMKGTACTAAGSNREVFFAHFDTFFLIRTGNGMLETSRVGRVTRNGNVDAFVVHDGNAFADVVSTKATDISPFALGIRNFTDDVQVTCLIVELGLNIGEAVDAGNDLSGVFTEAVQDNAKGNLAGFVGVADDTDSTFSSGKGFVLLQPSVH